MLVWRAPPAREVRALWKHKCNSSNTTVIPLQQHCNKPNAFMRSLKTAETVRNGAVRLCAPLVTNAAGAVAAVQECGGGVVCVCARASVACVCVSSPHSMTLQCMRPYAMLLVYAVLSYWLLDPAA